MITWTDIYFLSERLIQVVMLFVILRRRRRTAAMAWLLVVFTLPWLGLILYWMIGENKLPASRISKHRQLMEQLRQSLKHHVARASQPDDPIPSRMGATIHLAQKLTQMPVVSHNSVELLAEVETLIERLIADIDEASGHVHMIYYIYADDTNGNRLAEALIRAAKRGVEVRVLVDSVGARGMVKSLAPRMREGGVEVLEALAVGRFRRRIERLDLRNHRKLAIIDGRVAYTGSHNISDSGYGKRRLYLYDLTTRLQGPVVLELQAVFVSDWQFETDTILDGPNYFRDQPQAGDMQVQALPSGPNFPTENYQRMVTSAIHTAEESLIITTPYFIPDESLMQALEIARLRGVRIDLILPQRSDHFMVDAAARAYLEELLEAGVHVYLFRHGLLHAKTITVDNSFCLFGSANFDIRSFTINFELSLVFYHAEATRMVREQQTHYLSQSDELFLSTWRQRPLHTKMWQHMACLMSPIL